MVATLLETAPQLVSHCLETNDLTRLGELYRRVSMNPRDETKARLFQGGYIVDGPFFRGITTLVKLWDTEGRLYVCKMSDDQEELQRLHRFDRESHAPGVEYNPHVISFHLEEGWRGSRFGIIMPCCACMLSEIPFAPYNVTEYLNPTLMGIVNKFVRQISLGLEWMHALNYCHMDVKPQNIGVHANGDFVLIDLGSTSMVGERASTTIKFVPIGIEVTRGIAVASVVVDWWMLGVSVFRTMTMTNTPDQVL